MLFFAFLLPHLTSQVVSVRDDFVQWPITYYFRTPDDASALEVALPVLAGIVEGASAHDDSSVQIQAMLLQEALRDLTTYLAEGWLRIDRHADTEAVMAAYTADHLR